MDHASQKPPGMVNRNRTQWRLWKNGPMGEAALQGSVVLILIVALLLSPALGDTDPAALLRQAKTEKDAAKRIELLDEALKVGSAKKSLLSDVYFERGLAHKELSDCFRAIEDFTSATSHTRNVIPILLEKANCLIILDQTEEASRVLERVLLTDQGVSAVYVLKGMIYEKEGFLTRAEDEYTRALHYDQNSRSALDMRAQVRLKGGKPREALNDLNELSRLEPQRPEIFMTRARIYMKLKEYAQAVADYRRAEELMQGDPDIIKEKVLVLFKTHQPAKALEGLSAYSAAHPGDDEALVLVARAHILLGNDAEGERVLKRVLARDPDHAPAHLYSGVLAMRARDWDLALEHLNRAINLAPSLVESYKERARVFIELGEPARAASDLAKAAELDPSDGEIFALRGLTYLGRMLYDAAVADFTRALECLPADPRILYDRAVAYMSKEGWEPAMKDLDAVLTVRPQAARALSLRAIIHFNRNDLASARADFDRAAACGAQDPLVWNNRGFFNYKTGNYKTALEDFNRALRLGGDYAIAKNNLSLVHKKQESGAEPSLPPDGFGDHRGSFGKENAGR